MSSHAPNWTVGRLLNWTTSYLEKNISKTPRLDAEVLLAHSRQCSRIELYTDFESEVDETICTHYRNLIRRYQQGEPVAYLVGHKEFFSLKLEVTPSVLIPRPETEFVISQFLELNDSSDPAHICDMGTGSGNIAIVVAKQRPLAHITAVDICPDALKVARRNTQLHNLTRRIQLVQSDGFDCLTSTSCFDFILTNPPYVSDQEYSSLPNAVKNYEPKLALHGGQNGMAIIRKIADQATKHLNKGGCLIMEMGSQQEAIVSQFFLEHPRFGSPRIIADYQGHARVVCSHLLD